MEFEQKQHKTYSRLELAILITFIQLFYPIIFSLLAIYDIFLILSWDVKDYLSIRRDKNLVKQKARSLAHRMWHINWQKYKEGMKAFHQVVWSLYLRRR